MGTGELSVSAAYLAIFVIVTFLIVAISIWIAVRYSHRYFGPLPRINRELAEMMDTGTYHKIKIRESDSMHRLVSDLNLVIEKMIELNQPKTEQQPTDEKKQ